MKSTEAAPRMASIQIARAIAALSVVLYHSHLAVAAYPSPANLPFFAAYGSFGVDLFFVVSGFIIAHISRNGLDLAPYLIKRFFRIYPIYWLFLIASVYLYTRHDYRLGGNEYTTESLIKSFLIFPMHDQPWYAVGWTLEHEIIFYVVAGIVMSFAGYGALLTVLGTAGAVGIVLHSILPSLGLTTSFWDWHLIDPSMIEFFAGVAVYRYKENLFRLGLVAPFLFFLVSVALTIAAMDSGIAPLPAFGTPLVASAAAALIVTLLTLERRGYLTGPLSRFFILIGNASFSLYLVHWIVVLDAGRIKWKVMMHLPDGASELWRWGIVALCVTASIAMFYLIETPLNKFGHWLSTVPARPSLRPVNVTPH